MRLCKWCGKEIPKVDKNGRKTNINKRYCSEDCVNKRRYENYKKWAKAHPDTLSTRNKKKTYGQRHHGQRQAQHREVHEKRSITILWPDCGYPDHVTRTLWENWALKGVPNGTEVFIHEKDNDMHFIVGDR
jgi:hypothetical protein